MKRLITVSGSGLASGVPDVVKINVGVHAERPGVADALQEAAELAKGAADAAKAAGLAARDVGTMSASVHPTYDRTGQKINGYRAEHMLSLTVRDVSAVGKVVTGLAEAAGNGLIINDISLSIADTAPLEEKARERAFAAAKSKAEQYAGLASAALGDVVAIVEGGVSAPMPKMMMSYGRDSMAAPEMSVEAGEQSVGASVSVTWLLITPSA